MYFKIHKVGRSMYTVTSARPLYSFILIEVWQDLEPIGSQKMWKDCKDKELSEKRYKDCCWGSFFIYFKSTIYNMVLSCSLWLYKYKWPYIVEERYLGIMLNNSCEAKKETAWRQRPDKYTDWVAPGN